MLVGVSIIVAIVIPRLRKGKIAPEVERFVEQLIQEQQSLAPESVDTYLDMVKGNPILGMLLDTETLIALKILGLFKHREEKKQAFIRQVLKNIRGSWKWSFAEMYAAKALGSTFSEIEWGVKDGDWILESLRALDPRTYGFIGGSGRITGIRYKSRTGDVDIPIEKGCHIINKRALTYGDPYGVPTLQAAYAAWKAWKILMGQMLIAGQRKAMGIVVGYSDSNDSVPLFDEQGNPVLNEDKEQVTMPAPDALAVQLAGLENGSVLSTDKENRIEMLEQKIEGDFFLEAIALCEGYMLKAFAFPNTLLSTAGNGTGDSNLNEGHRELLEISITSIVEQITEELLEKIVRPLLFWNFGEEEDFGTFEPEATDETDKLELMRILIDAVSRGFFSAADESVINRGRELVGLPEVQGLSEAQLSAPPRGYFRGS